MKVLLSNKVSSTKHAITPLYINISTYTFCLIVCMSIGTMKKGTRYGGRNRPFVSFEVLLSNCKIPIEIGQNSFFDCIFSLIMLQNLYVFLFKIFCATCQVFHNIIKTLISINIFLSKMSKA